MSLFLSFLAGVALFFCFRFFPFCSAALFLASAALLIKKRRFVPVLIIVIGILYALSRTVPAGEVQPPFDKTVRITGKVLPKGPSAAGRPETQDFSVEQAVDAETDDDLSELEDRKIRLKTGLPFDPEETYDLLVHTGKDSMHLNPGSTGSAPLFARLIEVRGTTEEWSMFGSLFSRARQSLQEYIRGRFNMHSAAFITAITVGDAALDEGLKNAFNTTGLAHILSISGTHFGLFSVVIFGAAVFVIKRLPHRLLLKLTLYISPSQAAAVISLPLMVFYLGLSGGSIPAVRSFIMIGLFLLGLLIGRKGFWLNSVLLAAFLLALWDPSVIFSLSFQLSFIAVVFIGFAVAKKEETVENGQKSSRTGAFLLSSLQISLAATIGTAPLVAHHFHYASLISPVSNLLIAPLIGFVLIPLALISSFAYILTGHYLFAPLISVTADASLWLVRAMAKIPFADLAVPSFPSGLVLLFYAGFLVYFVMERKQPFLVLPFLPLIIMMIAMIFSSKTLSATFLDVGQGDSVVIELPDSRTVVIDTGRTGFETEQFLKYLGKRDIDALILTHAHPDHSGGAAYLTGRFRTRELWDNSRTDYPEGFAMPSVHRRLERGDYVDGRGYRLTVLHPYPEFYTGEDNEYTEENNASLVLRLAGEKASFLFAGDVEDEAEENLAHLGGWLKSDVIKVPHHGGRSSVHEGFIQMVSPAIAVISAGRDNSFGHPSEEMLGELAGRQVLRTDRDGAVKITETKKGLVIKTYRDFAFEEAGSFAQERKNLARLFAVW